ncbi:MAG: helix-turn-helix transcriptional regulator [Campylobacterota bacterium]|nr:helix-turn-helix transcriptional regulator [Campylobacterota bacterium]
MLDINISTPSTIMEQLKTNFKQKRLLFDLTQEGLSNKSGVSLGSLKRFESSGFISLESLLKLCVVLDCLDDFKNIAVEKKETIDTLEDLEIKGKSIKKRGRIK